MIQRLLILVLAVIGLSACGSLSDDEGWFVDRSDDYLEARQLPELEVPQDMRASEMADPFPIPQATPRANPQYFPARPPLPDALYADDSRREVRIQRLSSRQWLVVPEPPNTVWPKLKQFLAENGATVVFERPPEGRVDTGWFEVRSASVENYRDVVRLVLQQERENVGLSTGRERLRLRLEQGLQANTSELHLRHENDSMATPSPDGISSLNDISSSVPSVESELLNEIGAYIASRVSEQTVSKVATNIASTAKARMGRSDAGQPVLELALDYERAWAAVGRALDNATVEVTDAENGEYHVKVPSALFTGEDRPSFFQRVMGRGRAETYDLVLLVSGQAEDHQVSVRNPDGEFADRTISQEVLNLVREFAG